MPVMDGLRDWLIFHLFHQRRLTKAAGVSKVTLVCHPDTWDEIAEMSSAQKVSLKADGEVVKREDALVEVPLSGVSLVGILQATRNTWRALEDVELSYTHKYGPSDRAIALRVYLAIAHALNKVESYQAQGAPLPAIIIDDRQRPGQRKLRSLCLRDGDKVLGVRTAPHRQAACTGTVCPVEPRRTCGNSRPCGHGSRSADRAVPAPTAPILREIADFWRAGGALAVEGP